MCKGKNFIDFPIRNIYKTNKQAGGNVKNPPDKSQRLPAGFHQNTYVFPRRPAGRFLHPFLLSFPSYPQSYYYILIYSLF